jgi:hypothetical protein
MSSQISRDELRRFTLSELHTLHAQLAYELRSTAPGSAARQALEIALADIRREIALRQLPHPRF